MKRMLFALREHGQAVALVVGTLLLLAAVLGHWFVVEPLARDVAALAHVPSSRDELQQRIDETLARSATPQARLVAFRRHFGSDPALAKRLARLHVLAVRHGLELRRGDYRLGPAGDDALARYRMEIPIQGGYPNIRAFALQALHDMPTLSLEQLQIQRRSVAEQQVDALLVFNLFMAK